MSCDAPRLSVGTPAGGQFTFTARPETGPTLAATASLEMSPTMTTPTADTTRFGPQGVHVRRLLDRITALTPDEVAALSAHAPMVTFDGPSSEMFCPNADATRYTGLGRYRKMTRADGPMTTEVQAALAAVQAAAAHLPDPVLEALKDTAVAQVTFGKVHAVAYDTLTRAVRHALGPVRDADGPLHR